MKPLAALAFVSLALAAGIVVGLVALGCSGDVDVHGTDDGDVA